MIRKTYSIDDENKILICEEKFDESNNLIHQKDLKNIPNSEHTFEYNELNQLILEFEWVDGKICSRIEYQYNDEGEVSDQKFYFDDVLFEHTKLEKIENGFIKTTIQDGVEVERLEKNRNDKNWKNTFWSTDNKILEIQEYTYDEKKRIGTIFFQNLEDNLFKKTTEDYNANGELISLKEFNEKDILTEEIQFIYSRGLLIKEITKNFRKDSATECTYEYDRKGNLIKEECLNSKGKLITFQHITYDHQNRIISECGNEKGLYNLVYEYEK